MKIAYEPTNIIAIELATVTYVVVLIWCFLHQYDANSNTKALPPMDTIWVNNLRPYSIIFIPYELLKLLVLIHIKLDKSIISIYHVRYYMQYAISLLWKRHYYCATEGA